MSYSEEKNINRVLGNVKIKITEYKASKNEDYKKNYETMGLEKIDLLVPSDLQYED